MNSNIRRAVTDEPFSVEICQGCTFNPKNENPYWPSAMEKHFFNNHRFSGGQEQMSVLKAIFYSAQ